MTLIETPAPTQSPSEEPLVRIQLDIQRLIDAGRWDDVKCFVVDFTTKALEDDLNKQNVEAIRKNNEMLALWDSPPPAWEEEEEELPTTMAQDIAMLGENEAERANYKGSRQ